MILDLFAGPGGWDQGLAMLGRRDVVGVEFDGVACAARQLGTAADWATIEVDSGRPVSTIRIGIARAETKSTEPGPRVSITEIRPFTYA